MDIRTIKKNNIEIAVVDSKDLIIFDSQSALDFAMSMFYDYNIDRAVIKKSNIVDDFFILSTRLAGDVLQKLINYRFKLAIYGDYTKYTSKPLQDFIYECNSGRDVFFVATEEEAIEKLQKNY